MQANRRRWGVSVVVLSIGWAALALHGWRGDVRMDAAIGHWIVTHGRLPHHNWWTVAAWGRPFSDTEWLYAVLVAVLGRWGTFVVSGLVWSALAIAVVRWLAAWPWPWSGWAAIGWALLMVPVMPPRPELWSYLGWWGSLMALVAYRKRGHTRSVWAMAAVTLVWAQLHRSAWLVPALWGWELAAGPRPWRRGLWGPWALSLVAVLLPPAGGLAGLIFLLHVGRSGPYGVLNTIVEWLPPDLRTAWGVAVLAVVCLAWAGLAPATWRSGDRVGLGWLLGGTLAAMEAQRLAPYALLGWMVLATPALRGQVPAPRPGWWNGLALGAGLWIGIAPWVLVGRTGFFVPAWPRSALTALRRAGATRNLLAYQGDTLVGAGMRPWVDGQVQLVADRPWWPVWIATEQGRWSPAAFAARWDPGAQAIVWPTLRAGLPPLALLAPWHRVWQGTIRWGGTTATPSAIWVRIPADRKEGRLR